MKISCLIADDELPARQGLRLLLEDFADIEVMEVCADGVQAVDAIRAHRPDFVLLDVQMPHLNGFEVLASIPSPRPQVIFITAHDEFALKAFEVNAVDYLLKPFDDDRFAEAIARVRQKVLLNREDQGVENLLKSTNTAVPDSADRLVIKVDGNVHRLRYEEVVYVEAFDYYVKVHVQDRFLLVRESMRKMEEKLSERSFVRIHKSYIVNSRWVRSLVKEGNEHLAELTGGQRLKVSRSKWALVRQRLQNP